MLTYKLAMTKHFKVVTERMSGMPAAFSEEQQESIREELFQAGIRLSKSDGCREYMTTYELIDFLRDYMSREYGLTLEDVMWLKTHMTEKKLIEKCMLVCYNQ